MLVGDRLDRLVIEQQRRILGVLHVEFDERLRAKGAVCCDSNTVFATELDKSLLAQVRVVLDLECCGGDCRVTEQVQQQSTVVVAYTNALRESVADQGLHGLPGLGQRGVAVRYLVVLVGPAGWVTHRGVDVLESNGEVDNVQIKVVDAPVGKLLLADRFDLVLVVERVPEL